MKNRKTFKKLILGGLLLLTTGSLFAQTQKIHTLQVKNSSGTTTMNSDALIQMDSNNKGLLLPRIALTGANKEAPLTAHTAGMVVYNTATVAASGTGATAIEAVTPGYYYNNGTKWVKISSSDENEWKYDAATKKVSLVRSGTAPFTNKVYFNEKGIFKDVDFTTYSDRNPVTGAIETISVDDIPYSQVIKDSKNIESVTVAGPTRTVMSDEKLFVSADDTKDGNFVGPSFNVTTARDRTTNLRAAFGAVSAVKHLGTGDLKYGAGMAGYIGIRGGGTSSGDISGVQGNIMVANSGSLNSISGLQSSITLSRSGNIMDVAGYRNYMLYGLSSISPFSIENSAGVSVYHQFVTEAAQISNLYGYLYNTGGVTNSSILREYGMYLNDVKRGTQSNHAIYTNKGKNSFGDAVEIRTINANTSTNTADKVVVADATTGELKTKTVDDLVSTSTEWKYDATTKQIDLVRSGTAPFTNKVYFDENGAYKNIDGNSYLTYNTTTSAVENVATNNGANSQIIKNSKNVVPKSLGGHTRSVMSTEQMLIPADDTSVQTFIGQQHGIAVATDRGTNILGAEGASGSLLHLGTGDLKYGTGLSGSVLVDKGTSTGYLVGLYGEAKTLTSASLKSIRSFGANTNINGSGVIENVESVQVNNRFNNGATSQIQKASGVFAQHAFYSGSNVTVQDLYGYRYKTYNTTGAPLNVQREYGIYLDDVQHGLQNNYAIYTKAGKNSFGDKVEIRTINTNTSTNIADKVVVADATTGELKTKAIANIADVTNDAWINNTTTNVVELGTKADGTTTRDAGTEVVITDAGRIGVGVTSPSFTIDVANGDIGTGVIYSYGRGSSHPVFAGLARNTGDYLNPNYVKQGDVLSAYVGRDGKSHNEVIAGVSTSYGGSSVYMVASEDYTLTNKGAQMEFFTTPVGTVAQQRQMLISANGNIGMGTITPTEKLEVVGNGKFTGTVSTTGVLTTSDKRFKQGITSVASAMQIVNKLQPVSYTWSALGKKKGGDNKKHIGFIAQEVEKVLPNLVNTDTKGYKSVNYIEVIPVLTKALQEQQKEIDELKAMVKKLLK